MSFWGRGVCSKCDQTRDLMQNGTVERHMRFKRDSNGKVISQMECLGGELRPK